MTPKKLEQKVVNELLPRLQNEFDAFAFYRSASNWCENQGYKFAAKFFATESASELEHAKGIEKYLTDWNVIPLLPTIDTPVLKFSSLVDVIEQAYEMEYSLYEAYEQTAKKMLTDDLCTFSLIQKYLNIQLEAVAEYSNMLNELALIDSNDKFQVYYFEKRVFK